MLPAGPGQFRRPRHLGCSEQGQALLAVLFPHWRGCACTEWKMRETR